MDSITHGIAGWLLSGMLGMQEFASFIILGSVLPDIDILFHRLSHRDPRLYILTHGGYTHSIIGAVSLAFLIYLALFILSPIAPVMAIGENGIPVLLGLLTGLFLHISFDSLAFPGIPLLYPLTDRKFTIGIFPGPSLVLMVFSLFYMTYSWIRTDWNSLLAFYLMISGIFVALSFAIRIIAGKRADGLLIPTFNPLRWLSVEDRGDRYIVRSFTLLGEEEVTWCFEKLQGLSGEELEALEGAPELARHRYFSY
ncbi:metal-dependent hydrolase, partial [Methanothrix sp.]|uniref:metal-dependent hydrolase n=1 Tax=Methanothrix sp. TaxID=90426 RepID=UPI0034E26C3B